jgi:hypothetical protein
VHSAFGLRNRSPTENPNRRRILRGCRSGTQICVAERGDPKRWRLSWWARRGGADDDGEVEVASASRRWSGGRVRAAVRSRRGGRVCSRRRGGHVRAAGGAAGSAPGSRPAAATGRRRGTREAARWGGAVLRRLRALAASSSGDFGSFELRRGSDDESGGMGTLLEKVAIGCRSPLLCITQIRGWVSRLGLHGWR